MLSVGAVAEARVDRTPAVAAPPTSAEDATMNFLRESMRGHISFCQYARAGAQAAAVHAGADRVAVGEVARRRTRPEAFTDCGCSEYGKPGRPRQRLAAIGS